MRTDIAGLASGEALAKMDLSPRQMSLRERLDAQKRYLEAALSNVNAALQCLDDHPDIDKVLEILGRV